jgi:putative ABC transport system permease protein
MSKHQKLNELLKIQTIMFRNYFKIIWRGMLRQKMYSLIKIGGFAIGIAACLLIALYIRDELTYDRNFTDGDRIYRIVQECNNNGEIFYKTPYLSAPFAAALKQEFPEVENAGRINPLEIFGAGSKEIRRSDKLQSTHEEGFVFADQEFLDIFQARMVYGDRTHALDEPNTIVISKRKADKYFPNENPVGKTLIIDNNRAPYIGDAFVINYENSKPYRITGVIDFPSHSHFRSDFLISLSGFALYSGEQNKWEASGYPTYVKLRPGTDVARFEARLSGITQKYIAPGNTEAQKRISFKMQPVSDIYIKSDNISDNLSHGDMRFVWLFGMIALFILVIACINFINLSTATSANRAMEVGLRKTVGSNRNNLIGQFLTESMLYSFFSFLLGVALIFVLLPYFNVLFDKSLAIPWREWKRILPFLVFVPAVVGLLAGLYPAFYLSSFKPASVLKGSLSRGSKSSNIRSALVVFQFIVSIILITGTLIIHSQMGFILNKKLGFDKEQVLLLHDAYTMGDRVVIFKNELLKLSEVKSVSVSEYLPIEGTKRDGNRFWKEGKTNEEDPVVAQKWQVDRDYMKTMGMNIVEGRDFSKDLSTDSRATIINQTMAKKLGLTDPIGKRITNSWETFEVIGVVEDFHFKSLKENIGSLCLILGSSPNIVSVKVGASNMSEAIKSITGVWNKFSVNQPIRYSFLDEGFATMYADVQRMGHIFSIFALLAIIVACLGLFALSSFMIEQRTKEIGVRKVNGAKSIEVTATLNKDFLTWVAVAFVIATPIAYYAMNKWLENFAYKTSLSWWIFALTGVLALGIALLTVSWQSWKAATRNPVEALRYE